MSDAEERAAVAEAIRHYASESDESAYEFIRSYWPSDLADLIDPTCKNLTTRPADVLFCSECGEHVDIASVENADDYRARYCPNCGARVVSDDD